ncbi:MAG: sugar ABC transporter ATP-binding protein [Devosia sp.]
MSEDVVLRIANVSKSFGAIHALRGVDFDLRRGEIHAVAGENGAGKSTLMNVIDGILKPDSGEIILNGKPVEITSPARAQKLGIGFVHQEIALCPDVTVAENILMAEINASRGLFVDVKAIEAKARRALKQLSPIDPSVLVKTLSISNQQLVEIAKALTLDCQILILDEPTAALTEREAQVLFGIMRNLAERGISIIYISHRMVEIFEHCDRVSVFRDGKRIMTEDVANVTTDDIVNSMVGRVIGKLYPPKQTAEERSEESVLTVKGLGDGKRFRDVSFVLRKGEILGIAGLIGAGRSEIVKGICGLEETTTGEVTLNGRPLPRGTYRQSIDNGIVYLSEDRKGDGVFLDLSIASNVSALNLRQVSTPWGTVDRGRENQQARRLSDRLGLKRGGIEHPVSSLSGGNQQKVAIAKMLSVNPRIIFLDEPTRGVDVGAKAEIHRILRDLARSGVGVVVVSSELPELIGLCDRVLVVREGLISGEVEGDVLTEENIMRLASFTERANATPPADRRPS